MLDWKNFVRGKLSPMPMDSSKVDELVDELAQQLEDAYREARESGRTSLQAFQIALSQFQDWEKLRAQICESTNGSRLPVWQSKGFLSPRRPAVWIALALSCALFLVPSFRKALHLLPFSGEPTAWDENAFSENALARLEKSGDKQKYARALAYVALHCPDESRVVPAAEKAIALDPQLTWIAAKVSHANYLYPGYDPKPWLDRLQAWDPGNAFVYVLEAGAAVHSRWESERLTEKFSKGQLPQYLAANSVWREAMEKALAAPYYDSYARRQFLFDRDVLLETGLDRPSVLLVSSFEAAGPDFNFIQFYLDSLKVSQGNEQNSDRTGRLIAAHRQAILLGSNLRDDSESNFFLSLQVQQSAYESLIPLLRAGGHAAETDIAVQALEGLRATEKSRQSGAESSAAERAAFRTGRLLMAFGSFLPFLGVAVIVWIVSVSILRLKPGAASSLNTIAAYAVWSPLGFLISCLGVLTVFWPYSHSLAEFSDRAAFVSAYAPLDFGARWVSYLGNVWIENMFWSLILCICILSLGMVLLASVRSQRPPHQEAD